MKKIGIKIIAIGALTLIGASVANAYTGEDRWYISGTGALVLRNKENEFLDKNKNGVEYKNKLGWGTSIAIGRQMGFWRAELEAAYRKNKIKDFATVENSVNFLKEPVDSDKFKAKLAAVNADDLAHFIAGGGTKDDFTPKTAQGYKDALIADSKGIDAYTRDFAIMANLYYDIPVCDCFSVYLGAGAGVSFNEIAIADKIIDTAGKVTSSDHSFTTVKNTLFAWQVMTGVAYDLSEDWTLTLGYRLFATAKPKYQTGTETIKAKKMPLSHNFEIGLRYKF